MIIDFKTTIKVHDPFGMITVGRNWTAGSSYRYGFNGKEQDPETYGNGNIYDYGFRIYNPRLGKFLSIDPLRRKFPMLSPYQFASNTPIMAYDLDGLEGVVGIAGKGGEGTYYKTGDSDNFERRARAVASVHTYSVSTGKMLLDAMEDATKKEQSIQTVVIYSHGTSDAIVLDWNSGFFTTSATYKLNPGAVRTTDLAKMVDDGRISFTSEAKILLLSCNSASADNDKLSLAEEITDLTGVTTIGSDGLVEPINIGGKESGKSSSTNQFYEFNKVHIVTYEQDGKTKSKSFDTNDGALIYQGILKDQYNLDSAISTEIKRKPLGNTINPQEYK